MKHTTPKNHLNRRPRDTAFTLTELLVVISLIVLLLAIAVPAFSSMLYNNNRSLANTQLRVALATARDQAIRSEGGDTAAVFFFQPGGKLKIVTCVQIARFEDDEEGTPVERDIFVPVGSVNPVELPQGWVVRGYLPPQPAGRETDRWYGTKGGSLEERYAILDGCWLFPETGFYSPADTTTGDRRTSFMVRFEAGTGAISKSKNYDESLIIDLAPMTSAQRSAGSYALTRIDQAADLATTVRRLLDSGTSLVDDPQRQETLGDASLDTVMARPVNELAVLDERRMVQQLDQGAGQLNASTGCLYGDPANRSIVPTTPRIDTSLFNGATPREISQWVSQWINGTYPGRNGPVGEATLYMMNGVSGQPREISQ